MRATDLPVVVGVDGSGPSLRADVKVSTDTVPEEPEDVLLRESRNASLLVTGTRGRSGVTEALLGSVSLTVAGHRRAHHLHLARQLDLKTR